VNAMGWLRLGRRPRAARLRMLVLELSDRCDQRCMHCSIWEGPAAGPARLSLDERLKVVDDALAAGAREALLTGGEPLLSEDLWPVAARLRAGGARVLLSTNGMLLERYAAEAARLFHEVYISLDGADAATHDGLRGVASFARLVGGIAALRRESPRPLIVLRSTVHAGNIETLAETVATARGTGADHVSFLPLDASSAAFGGRPGARRALVPTAEQVRHLRATVEQLGADGRLGDGFVLESAARLQRLADHLDGSGGRRPFARPRCDAPRWSSVVTADGTVRPCFFHAPVGDVRRGLGPTRASTAYREALSRIDAPNDTCGRCVCPKWRGPAWREVLR
jgi:Fe-coproporphyrin III synthase